MSGRFVASAPSFESLPDLGLPEVALAGRSNVGKSSLLGCLLGQPRLVRVSRTPGRTELLNLFVLDERVALVDLPGYGYAKVSKVRRAAMSARLREYLRNSQRLKAVIQVVDARRDEVSDLDTEAARFVLGEGRALVIAATKIDRVPKNRRVHQLRRVANGLSVPAEGIVACSAKTGEGRERLTALLWDLA